ncbi:unnamed protein product [Caenorhabditis brenneri]
MYSFILPLFLLTIPVIPIGALDCQQIQSSQIFDGSLVYLPGNSSSVVPLPANFNCIYKIPAPLNSTYGFYVSLTLISQLNGANDYITVTDTVGEKTTLTSRNKGPSHYYVLPGREVYIQVVTKSVLMNSMISITAKYHRAQFGPEIRMRRDEKMNFVPLGDLRDSSWYSRKYSSSVTYIGDEQIFMTVATAGVSSPASFLSECYVIDGTFYDQKSVHRLYDFVYYHSFITTSNTITIASFQDEFSLDQGVVLNTLSEASQYNKLISTATNDVQKIDMTFEMRNTEKGAVEVVDFESNPITMLSLNIESYTCNAVVVEEAPNNSSRVVLDLTKAQRLMPYTFNLTRFSIIADPCSLRFSVLSNFR